MTTLPFLYNLNTIEMLFLPIDRNVFGYRPKPFCLLPKRLTPIDRERKNTAFRATRL